MLETSSRAEAIAICWSMVGERGFDAERICDTR